MANGYPFIPDEYEGWIQTHWRPAVAWQYVIVCLFDFMIAPVFIALYSHWTGITYVPWVSLTLQGGGLYHLSMGAIIGVSAWSRGKEKIEAMTLEQGITTKEVMITKQTQTGEK